MASDSETLNHGTTPLRKTNLKQNPQVRRKVSCESRNAKPSNTQTDTDLPEQCQLRQMLTSCITPPLPLPKDTSLSTLVLFDPVEISNSVLYPGNKLVARVTDTEVLHATIPHE